MSCEYKIIQSDNIFYIQPLIEDALNKGWQLVGTIFMHSVYFAQAMTRNVGGRDSFI